MTRLTTAGPPLVVLVVALLTVTSVSLVFAAPALGATTQAPSVSGGGDIAGCVVITGPGSYRLTGPVTDSTAPVCIDIQSSDVVFDGGGFVIDGVSAPGSVGISADGSAATLTNVTVRNVVVTEWADGLRYVATDTSLVETARFDRNGNGTVLAGTTNVVLRNVDVAASTDRGVALERTTLPGTAGDNRLSDVRVTGSGTIAVLLELDRTTVERLQTDGGIVMRSTENELSSVTATAILSRFSTTLTDVTTEGSIRLSTDGNRLSNVSITGGGLSILGSASSSGSRDNVLTDVTVVGAVGVPGISITNPMSNIGGNDTLRDVVVRDSSVGILLFNAPNTTITNAEITDTNTGVAVSNNVDSVGAATFLNVTLERTTDYGFRVRNAGGNTFVDVSTNDTGIYGFWFEGSGENQMTNVSATNSGRDGFFFAAVPTGLPTGLYGGNVVTDLTASDNGRHGLYVSRDSRSSPAAAPSTFDGVVASGNGVGNGGLGVFLLNTVDTTLSNVTASGNGAGVLVRESTDTTVTDAILSDSAYGFAAVNSDGVYVDRITALNNTPVADVAVVRSTNVTGTDVQLSSARLSFTGSGLGFTGLDSTPAAPDGRLGIESAFETVGFEAAPTVDVAVAYDDAAVTAAGVDESTLALFRYNDTEAAWGELPGSSVDTTANVVRATLTGAGVYGAFGEPADLAVAVTIAVRPGEEPTPINPDARGVIPVAILATGEYDVATIDVSSLRFGPTDVVEAGGGAAPVRGGHFEDVDADGDLDLVVHVRTADTGFAAGDTEARLVGAFADGTVLVGTDEIVTVG